MSVYQSAPALEQAAITAKDFNFWYGDFHAVSYTHLQRVSHDGQTVAVY